MTILAPPVHVYLCGPMSGIDDDNRPAFALAAAALRAIGRTSDGHPLRVTNPGEIGEQPGWMWTDYMRRGIAAVASTDLVVELPGVEEFGSRGARLELRIARALQIPIIRLGQLTDPDAHDARAIRVTGYRAQHRPIIALERVRRPVSPITADGVRAWDETPLTLNAASVEVEHDSMSRIFHCRPITGAT